ncbi:MAG: hypothetical protein ACI9KF_000727 [Arenicella sp.]|jgi:hypothetical protein
MNFSMTKKKRQEKRQYFILRVRNLAFKSKTVLFLGSNFKIKFNTYETLG